MAFLHEGVGNTEVATVLLIVQLEDVASPIGCTLMVVQNHPPAIYVRVAQLGRATRELNQV